MSYVVLARKWRPMSFSDLVGQGHVATTLGNAIAQNRVAHAFLFTGVRGVGKTTSARILAKALNCLSSDGPTIEPCLKCSACLEIAKGTDVDVQEIDGASYNGVDEVRRLQESMPYRPSRDRYKIFIVDEVHMLTQSAWNAFLKTLEEPPPHVKFIFATTEVHKVPVTILSRVQRFDFKLIGSRAIMERLRFVLAEEKVAADDEALALVARQAAGSMRDAMSLLDQVIAWNDTLLTGAGVAAVLGVPTRNVLYDLARNLAQGNAAELLTLINSLANQGFDLAIVARDLLGLLRDVVVAALGGTGSEALDLPAEEHADIQALAQHATDDWLRLYQAFSRGYDELSRGAQLRASLEMLLVRLARRPALVPLDDLVGRLIRLERRLSGARPGGDPSPQRPGSGGVPGISPSNPTPTRPSAPTNPPRRTESAPAPPAASGITATALQSTLAPAPREAAPFVAPRFPLPVEPSSATPLTARDGSQETAPASDLERWRSLADMLRKKDARLGAFLDHAQVHTVNADVIHVSFDPQSVFEGTLDPKETREQLAQAAETLFGRLPNLNLVRKDASGQTVFEVDRQARLAREQELLEQARRHPVIQEAIRVLGARVKHIELPPDA